MSVRRAGSLLLLGAIASACGPSASDDPSRVKRLRILSIQAEPPDLAPGSSTTFSALIADPAGAGRAISRRWGICVPLLGIDPTLAPNESVCANPSALLLLSTSGSFGYDVPANALDGLTPSQQQTGIDIPVALQVNAGSDRHTALKRLHISTSGTHNSNPSLTSLTIGLDAGSGDAHVPWGGVSALSVAGTDPDNPGFNVFFYVTAGGIGGDGANETSVGGTVGWNTGGDKPAEAFVYAVADDAQGGHAWIARRVLFQ